jgi:hypothetical protein
LLFFRFKILPTIIRFEEWDSTPGQELTYNLQARFLELRSWLYRPFVYFAIHHRAEHDKLPEAKSFVEKAIECCFHMVQSKPTKHRHHGSWFAGRNVLSAALQILAAVKAGEIVDYLVDWPDLIDQAISSLDHWSSASRAVAQGRFVLERIRESLSGQQL